MLPTLYSVLYTTRTCNHQLFHKFIGDASVGYNKLLVHTLDGCNSLALLFVESSTNYTTVLQLHVRF